MQIKTISGHLTTTNKTHIKAMFERGLMSAKVNMINYHIERLTGPNDYKVVCIKPDNSIVLGPKIDKSIAVFKLND